jgi:fructose-specific phosphotransferase system component IIB
MHDQSLTPEQLVIVSRIIARLEIAIAEERDSKSSDAYEIGILRGLRNAMKIVESVKGDK